MKVQTDVLRNNSEVLNRAAQKVESCMEMIEHARRNMAEERYGEHFQEALRSEVQKLQQLQGNFQELKFVLLRTADMYERAEDAATEKADSSSAGQADSGIVPGRLLDLRRYTCMDTVPELSIEEINMDLLRINSLETNSVAEEFTGW